MRNVAVFFGGPALEHEISVVSGRQVLEGLDRTRYHAIPVLLERDGAWVVDGQRSPDALAGARQLAAVDVCFLAFHGPFGEDGTIQGFLETVGLPYTGSGVAGSALCADKVRTKRLLHAYGLPGAADVTIPPAPLAIVPEALGFPVVVKNPYQGSTLGLRIVENRDELRRAVAELGAGCDRLLIEKREYGRELTAAILENEDGEPECLPLVEICPRDGFYDFQEKYNEDGAQKHCPATLPDAVTATVSDAALKAHRVLGLRGMSRTDVILREDFSFVVLETNTIPGLTPTSLLPKAAAAAGIDFPTLLTRLIESAMRVRSAAYSG